MPFEASVQLASTQLTAKGKATDQAADVSLRFSGLPLKVTEPYLGEFLTSRLDGQVVAELDVHWSAAASGKAGQTLVRFASLDVDKLRLLGKQKPSLVSIDKLQLRDVALDLRRRSALIQRLQVIRPGLDVSRTANGRCDAGDAAQEDWQVQTRAQPEPPRAAEDLLNWTTSPTASSSPTVQPI